MARHLNTPKFNWQNVGTDTYWLYGSDSRYLGHVGRSMAGGWIWHKAGAAFTQEAMQARLWGVEQKLTTAKVMLGRACGLVLAD